MSSAYPLSFPKGATLVRANNIHVVVCIATVGDVASVAAQFSFSIREQGRFLEYLFEIRLLLN